jgi:hypothetical protein
MTVSYVPDPPWPAPSNASQYGRDLSCITDLGVDMAEATGRQVLAEALARRVITPNNTLLDCPEYGFDLTAYCNADIDRRTLAEISQQTKAQFLQDDRVLDAVVEVSYVGDVLIVAATIVDGAGPFRLTLSVDQVDVSLLKVG